MQLPTLYKCLLLTLLLALAPKTAHARPPSDVDHTPNINFGFAANIDCHDGTETLSMVPNIPAAKGAGWVIPIPAEPNRIQIQWIPRLPLYRGRTPASMFHQQLAAVFMASRATQIYPVVFEGFFSAARVDPAEVPNALNSYPGVACELYSHSSIILLRQQIADSGIAISPNDIDRLSPFLDGHHSFLFIRIESLSRYLNALRTAGISGDDAKQGAFHDLRTAPCLQLRFPFDHPILPMLAVSNNPVDYVVHVQHNVSILGYAALAPDPTGIEPTVRLSHFRGTRQDDYSIKEVLPYTRVLYNGPTEQLDFTQITGTDFNQIDQGCQYIESPRVFWTLLLGWIAFWSYFCGGIAGLVAAKRWHPYAILALWNFATILALRFRLVRRGIDEKTRFTFLWTFSLSFFAINTIAPYLVTQYLSHHSQIW